ncbi:hypothetical protein BH11PAT2_BH11PAT2_04780 [soil metagenome]
MAISSKSLERFRAIYESQYGKILTDEELDRKARMLLNLYKAIYGKPIKRRKRK